jgi:succinoglycan biosynthesis protein ExoA
MPLQKILSDGLPLSEEESSMQQSEAIDISVVISCRNEIQLIRLFLESLFQQDIPGLQVEVLIADGASEDGTRHVLAEFEKQYPALRVLDNPEKIAAAGLNRAIRESRGEIILRMDAHTIYAPDYVKSCLEVLYEANAENVGGPALTRAEGYIPQAIAHAFHAPFAVGGAKFRDPHYEGPTSTVPYGCWRKSTLECVGLFDEEMVRGQDDELNHRIISAGGTVWQSPKIVSWYQPRANLSALFWQYFQNGFWKVAAIRKHCRPASFRNLVPATCLLLGFALPVCAAVERLGGSPKWQNIFLAAWIALAGLYLTVSYGSAILVARRAGWKFLPILPIVFATYQFSYALGFLLGLLHHPAGRHGSNPRRKVATTLTR